MKTLLFVGSLLAAAWITDASASTYQVHAAPQDRALTATAPAASPLFSGAYFGQRGAGRSFPAYAPAARDQSDENNANGS